MWSPWALLSGRAGTPSTGGAPVGAHGTVLARGLVVGSMACEALVPAVVTPAGGSVT